LHISGKKYFSHDFLTINIYNKLKLQ